MADLQKIVDDLSSLTVLEAVVGIGCTSAQTLTCLANAAD